MNALVIATEKNASAAVQAVRDIGFVPIRSAAPQNGRGAILEHDPDLIVAWLIQPYFDGVEIRAFLKELGSKAILVVATLNFESLNEEHGTPQLIFIPADPLLWRESLGSLLAEPNSR